MEAFTLLPDPQTNGGLLISVREDSVDSVKKTMLEFGLADFILPVGLMVGDREKEVFVK